MAAISLKSYYSQFDGDSKYVPATATEKAKNNGQCIETCCKMIDRTFTEREIGIWDITMNGDKDTKNTTIAGAKSAAAWLGWGLNHWWSINPTDIKNWLNEGRLIIAIITYSKIPNLYKQDLKYQGGHAIVISGIDESNNSIRYADPDFSGARRNDGWYNNNKWISWSDLSPAWADQNYLGFTTIKTINDYKPQPIPQPETDYKKLYETCLNEKAQLERQKNILTQDIAQKNNEIGELKKQNEVLSLSMESLKIEAENDKLYATENAQKLLNTVNTLTEQVNELRVALKASDDKVLAAGEIISSLEDDIKKKQTIYEKMDSENYALNQMLKKMEEIVKRNTELENENAKLKIGSWLEKILKLLFKK